MFKSWTRRFRRPRIELALGDITTEHVDAIVNAAKPSLMGGGGVDGAIHRAGGPAILAECRIQRTRYPDGLPTGWAVVTTAGDMPAKMVVHTVGPVYDGTYSRAALLRSCYTESLAAADHQGARTVAFPLISAGVYGWPTEDATRQALTAIRSAKTSVKLVRLVLFDEETYRIARSVYEGAI